MFSNIFYKIVIFLKKLFNVEQDNVIYYTTYDKRICKINYDAYPYPFGDANVISNTYKNNKGMIKFDKPVKCISGYTFLYSENLETITLPDSIENISSIAFNNQKIKAFYGKFASDDNISLIINNKLIAVAFAGIKSYTVPDNIENFSNIFNGIKRKDLSIILNKHCGNSQDFYHSYVQLISNIDNVPNNAFEYNTFSKIILGENTKTIGKHAFMRAKGEYYYDIALYTPYLDKCEIICKAPNPPILGDEFVFGSISPGTDQDWYEDDFIYQSIKVPQTSLYIYKRNWNKYSNYIHSETLL